MQIKVEYQFQGRDRNWVCNPLGNGLYQNLADYQTEFCKYFPDATFEVIPEEINEFEIVEKPQTSEP